MNRRAFLFVLGVLGGFGPLSIDTYLPSLPRIASQLHASSSLVQLSITTSLLGLAFGQLVAGSLSDRHGRRPVVLVGVCAFAVSSALCAITHNIGLLIGLRLVQGLAGAAGIVVSRAIVRDLYSGAEMSRIFSRLLLVTGTAPVVAPILGAQILRIGGWRAIFWVLAGIGVLVAIASAAIIPETLAPENRTAHTVRQDLALYGRIVHDRAFIPYMLVTGLFGGVLFAFISGSPFVVQKIYHHSPTVFSLVFGGVSAMMITLGQVNARLVKRVPLRRLLRAAMGISCAGAVGVLFVATVGTNLGLWAFIVALLFAVSPNGMVNPNATALGMESYAVNAGAASALLGLCTFLVGALMSPLVGIAGEHTAVPLGVVMCSCAVLGLVGLVALERPIAPPDALAADPPPVSVPEDLPAEVP
jgi:DHA1 family bicyclomycin/chloramphenicol resistance-like MFS transporter